MSPIDNDDSTVHARKQPSRSAWRGHLKIKSKELKIFNLLGKDNFHYVDSAPSDLQTLLPLLEFFPIDLIAIINKTLLHNGNYPITNLITEMGVAHTMGQYVM